MVECTKKKGNLLGQCVESCAENDEDDDEDLEGKLVRSPADEVAAQAAEEVGP